jgi:phage gpG-like protein
MIRTFGAVIAFDVGEIDRAFDDVELRARRMGPAFRELRKPMRGDQREHARRAEGPGGHWPARAPATEERRLRRNRRLRIPKALRLISPVKTQRRSTPAAILGRLPRALRIDSGELWVRATSRATFGGSHNEGAMVGRRRSVKLPRREFVWVSDEFIAKCEFVFLSHLVQDWIK